jgi:DNA-binding MarR family transcriptional regulator
MNPVTSSPRERAKTTAAGRSDLRLNSFLPYVLNNLAERVSGGLARIYSDDYQLSIPEWRVIANLAEHGTLNARQIVEFTSMEKSKVSRAVSNLSARGLVSQQRAQGDSRAKDLALTRAGRQLYGSIVPKALAWERDLLDELSSGEYRDLLYLLQKLGSRLKSMP